ncbi:hypothetical protein EYF80_007182 [Liparis tanakae]|uniref:Uncharacterized protein n=1 Tax=Liparis tanakae TaxID=230148 RepID=A0A4Z2IYP0_9TELE|nr:hypothetical protein EYF80_007182 [Liparis tanakae]
MATSLAVMATGFSVLMATNTCCTAGQLRTAVSTVSFSSLTLPPLTPWFTVMTVLDWAGNAGQTVSPSRIRSARASALKPANTTLCAAPIRAQANMDATASGQVGMSQSWTVWKGRIQLSRWRAAAAQKLSLLETEKSCRAERSDTPSNPAASGMNAATLHLRRPETLTLQHLRRFLLRRLVLSFLFMSHVAVRSVGNCPEHLGAVLLAAILFSLNSSLEIDALAASLIRFSISCSITLSAGFSCVGGGGGGGGGVRLQGFPGEKLPGRASLTGAGGVLRIHLRVQVRRPVQRLQVHILRLCKHLQKSRLAVKRVYSLWPQQTHPDPEASVSEGPCSQDVRTVREHLQRPPLRGRRRLFVEAEQLLDPKAGAPVHRGGHLPDWRRLLGSPVVHDVLGGRERFELTRSGPSPWNSRQLVLTSRDSVPNLESGQHVRNRGRSSSASSRTDERHSPEASGGPAGQPGLPLASFLR